jgi:starvation-inducible outer membrane lipoprotein
VVRLALLLFFALTLSSCVTVPQNRRAKLADPMMSVSDDPIETYRKQKLYNSREGAAGGDGVASGGGCGCQ